VKIKGREYKIVKELYRTKWSKDQRLSEEVPKDRLEDRRKFFVVTCEKNHYFVKEYVDRDYGSGSLLFPDNIVYEANETKRLRGRIEIDGGEIDVPRVIAMEDNKIVFEYLEGYKKLGEGTFNQQGWDTIQTLVRAWVSEKSVRNYDLCNNNTLYLSDGRDISLRMVDFEYSEDRDPKKELCVG